MTGSPQPTPDLSDPALYQRGAMADLWAALQDRAPVYWNAFGSGPGFWALTRYADVARAHADTVTFSSESGVRLETQATAVREVAGAMLLVTDPPRHTELRRAFAPLFAPRVLGELLPVLSSRVDDLVLGYLAASNPDFVSAVATPLASTALTLLLDLSAASGDAIQRLTHEALAGSSADARQEANAELFLLASELVADPPSDVIHRLVSRAFRDGLTPTEISVNVHGLFLAANETTRYAAAGGVFALCVQREAWTALKGRPEAVNSAVEEVLRWTTPGMHVMRTATTDVTIASVAIAAGDHVTLWLTAANMDHRVFRAPAVFDPLRSPNRHLTFGLGPHSCIGALLARLELRALLRSLVSRVDEIALGGKPASITSNHLQGFSYLPLDVIPRR